MPATTTKRAISRDGHPVTILRSHFEDDVEFAVVRYEDGHLPHAVGGRVAGTEDAPLWEHRVEDGKVVRSGGDYWNDNDWHTEAGLRPFEGDDQDWGHFVTSGLTWDEYEAQSASALYEELRLLDREELARRAGFDASRQQLIAALINGAPTAAQEGSTMYAEAVKLEKEKWEPRVLEDGVDEPIWTGATVKTKKQAEALALEALEAREAKAPTATEVADVTGIPTAGSLVEGMGEALANEKGTYHRLIVNDKAIAYANPRKDGVLLDFAAKTVEGQDTPGLEVKGSRAVLHVTADNAPEARAFLERLTAPAIDGSDEHDAAVKSA